MTAIFVYLGTFFVSWCLVLLSSGDKGRERILKVLDDIQSQFGNWYPIYTIGVFFIGAGVFLLLVGWAGYGATVSFFLLSSLLSGLVYRRGA